MGERGAAPMAVVVPIVGVICWFQAGFGEDLSLTGSNPQVSIYCI